MNLATPPPRADSTGETARDDAFMTIALPARRGRFETTGPTGSRNAGTAGRPHSFPGRRDATRRSCSRHAAPARRADRRTKGNTACGRVPPDGTIPCKPLRNPERYAHRIASTRTRGPIGTGPVRWRRAVSVRRDQGDCPSSGRRRPRQAARLVRRIRGTRRGADAAGLFRVFARGCVRCRAAPVAGRPRAAQAALRNRRNGADTGGRHGRTGSGA